MQIMCTGLENDSVVTKENYQHSTSKKPKYPSTSNSTMNESGISEDSDSSRDESVSCKKGQKNKPTEVRDEDITSTNRNNQRVSVDVNNLESKLINSTVIKQLMNSQKNM